MMGCQCDQRAKSLLLSTVRSQSIAGTNKVTILGFSIVTRPTQTIPRPLIPDPYEISGQNLGDQFPVRPGSPLDAAILRDSSRIFSGAHGRPGFLPTWGGFRPPLRMLWRSLGRTFCHAFWGSYSFW